MKKLFSVFFALLVFSSLIFAQKASLGIGANIDLPMSKFGDYANVGFGATARGEMNFAPGINGMVTVGYLTWGSKDLSGLGGAGSSTTTYSMSCIPLMAGIKYFFQPSGGFYGFFDLGLNMFTIKAETKGGFIGASQSNSSSESKFGFGAGVGYEAPIGKNMKLDASGKYQWNPDDLHYFDVRVGVKFPM